MNTKTCICGKKMIRRNSDVVMTSNPPQWNWFWWCACGHQEYGGREIGLTEEQRIKALWQAAQK
jgi:hypothetical protein